MDAVEAAQSGHPGTPMALAPVAYVLWSRFLRHNPRNPAWPDRDRFVLSAGHASMLLYSPAPPERVRSAARGIAGVPAVGVAHAGPSGARPHARGRDHDRSPGSGRRQRRGHGDRRAYPRRAFQPPGPSDHRSSHLGDRQRRRPDGRGRERGLLPRRAPAARQAHPGLRRQPHHDRRRHGARLLRGRGASLRGLRLARREGGRRQRSRRHRRGARGGPQPRRTGPTLVVLRTYIADPAPTKRDTAEAHGAPLGAEEVQPDQGDHGVAAGAQVLHSGRRAGALARCGGRGARPWRRSGVARCPPTPPITPSSPPSSSSGSRESFRRAGTAVSRC